MIWTARLAIAAVVVAVAAPAASQEEYLAWTEKQATAVGREARKAGRVGRGLNLRGINTDRAINYKLRATWLTGDVVRASARLAQLTSGLSRTEAESLVSEAENAGEIIVLVEIDPNEGSGVVPLDWTATFGEVNAPEDRVVRGRSVPSLREKRGLAGVFRRDYDYEAFWMVFPATTSDGRTVLGDGAAEAELVVRIYDKVGRVNWPIPSAFRGR